ncbi:hypothetical protein [Fangia hongkongensis]|uniref:hypothetical protein n=1 Tax=Fangia hongkongensis TaxID=270495 RepID=UPI000363844F|nr:hypothetical protein [Fangia hongkongensis]
MDTGDCLGVHENPSETSVCASHGMHSGNSYTYDFPKPSPPYDSVEKLKIRIAHDGDEKAGHDWPYSDATEHTTVNCYVHHTHGCGWDVTCD